MTNIKTTTTNDFCCTKLFFRHQHSRTRAAACRRYYYVLPCLMVFMLTVQVYQVQRLESSVSMTTMTGATSTTAVGGKGRRRSRHMMMTMTDHHNLRLPGSDRIRTRSSSSSTTTTSTTGNTNNATSTSAGEGEESFSACLMIMDDNAHLIEWIAYHYTKLPLRRLIVGVDPRSQTSPTQILQRWTGLIDITEWHEVDFMPPELIDKHLHMDPSDHQGLTDLFRQRQEHFYTRCMARLKYERKTWTAFIDTDEYILINKNAMSGYRVYPFEESNSEVSKTMTVLDGIQRMTSSPATTIQQQQQQDVDGKEEKTLPTKSQVYQQTSPCLAMARVAFGVKESEANQIQNGVPTFWGLRFLPTIFSPTNFQTMRWRYHSGRGAKKTNKISKSLLDVSQIESDLFVPHEQVMVHLPSKKYCHTGGAPSHLAKTSTSKDGGGGGLEQHLWVLNAHSPLVVHHYSGTWEQWSHRKDTRGKRTWENYQKMAYDAATDDTVRPWLQQFVDQVGSWTARQLLDGVGMV
mmetsp:Transcript_28107/g.68348  ORF Transcript_28107/g.68348 Transcript_28107/m.68348 type:complete len:519 (-) Transcript_28107:234-1790(-)